MKTTSLISVLSIIFFTLNASADQSLEKIDVVKRCQTEKLNTCSGSCLDGWENYCYFDLYTQQIDRSKLLEQQKDNCYAYFESSVCEPCKQNYLIKNNDSFKNVTCEEFYQTINEKNESCSGCLRQTFNGGG